MSMSMGIGFNPMMGMGMMGMGMGMMSGAFMSGMSLFGGMSSTCCGMGSMVPFRGFPMARGGMRSDPVPDLFAQIAKNNARTNKKIKSSLMGGMLGKVLGIAAGVGIAAAIVGTGGMALPILLGAGMLGAGVGGSMGFLLGGGGSLINGGRQTAQSYARFL